VTFQTIPIQPNANQSFSTLLDANVLTQFNITTTDEGTFIDVTYGGASICMARLCQDRTNLNTAAYLGMPQPLFFADLLGTTDPVYTGFGTRYLLCYGTPD
jgi:hypothetical protein